MQLDRKPLLLRADAGPHIGTGHVMRCLALAQAWQDAGGQSHFALASEVLALEARLCDEGMAVHHLEPEAGGPSDAAATIELAHQLGAAWVVADGYHFDATYQQAIRAAELKLLFIDDYGHAGRYCADVVLNQNIYADESLYAYREPHTRLLLGTRYALLRREFWPWRGWRREIPPVARKVLVTLGGSDPDNLTLTVLRALQRVDVDGLEVVVVVGGSNPHFQELEAAIRHSLPGRAIRLVRNVTDMPELMSWADMAVSGGGSTCWELAFMGLPSLALILAENQRPVITGLAAAGAVINLGQPAALAPIEIARSLTELAATPGKRAAMTERGQALVDGDGARRVVQRMLSRALTLRPVQADDCRLIWEWANDPLTRAVSFSVEPIPWEKHMAWFTDRLSDPRCRFYIALDATAQPIGQIRYQIEGEEAVVSVSLALEQRGKGYGAQVIRLGSEIIFSSTTVRLIHAYVKPDNTGSACAFANAGFVNDGLMEIQGHSALHFVLRK